MENYQFDTVDVLYRIITPLGMALIALAQFPTSPTSQAGNVLLLAVMAVGFFITFNQSLDCLDRRLNTELYKKGIRP